MNTDDIAKIRGLLIKFGRMSKREQTRFLSNLNDFMYASPQHRKQMLREWEGHYPLPAEE
jgi:hypothetical protein